MQNFIILISVLLAAGSSAFAKDIQIGRYGPEMAPYVRATNVWERPDWINGNLEFVGKPNILRGPKAKGYAKILAGYGKGPTEVYCRTTFSHQFEESGGKTPKFKCQLMEKTSRGLVPVTKDDGSQRDIKVKFAPAGQVNREIQGELLGTRLLWALGFGADQMFYVDRLICLDCAMGYSKTRHVVPGQNVLFQGVAVERKTKNDELLTYGRDHTRANGSIEEWSGGLLFSDLMRYLPRDTNIRKIQLARRDALRLLAVFMHHTDLKKDNQRFSCLETNRAGQCTKTFFMIHDIGTSFGVRLRNGTLQKVNLAAWSQTPVWKDPHRCVGQIGSGRLETLGVANVDGSMAAPRISESGRQFLAKLLTGFASDQRRVRDLFRAAHVEEADLNKWIAAFNHKVAQVANPTGNPNFRCPKSPYE